MADLKKLLKQALGQNQDDYKLVKALQKRRQKKLKKPVKEGYNDSKITGKDVANKIKGVWSGSAGTNPNGTRQYHDGLRDELKKRGRKISRIMGWSKKPKQDMRSKQPQNPRKELGRIMKHTYKQGIKKVANKFK